KAHQLLVYQRLAPGTEHLPGAESARQPCGGLRIDRVETDQPVGQQAVSAAARGMEAGRIAAREAAEQGAAAVGGAPVEIGVACRWRGRLGLGRSQSGWRASASTAATACAGGVAAGGAANHLSITSGSCAQSAWKRPSAASARSCATSNVGACNRSVMLSAAS